MSTKSDTQIKAQFLAALRQGRTVSAAAKSAGISTNKLYYDWRANDPAFAAKWQSILQAQPSGKPGRPWHNNATPRKPRPANATFLKALSKGATVAAAAKAAGVSRARVYQWAQTDKAFAQEWETIIQNRQSEG